MRSAWAAFTCGLLATSCPALADTVSVAVAANFLAPLEALAEPFRAETGHDLLISSGATGLLYTQITQAAPFDVFLSADNVRPAQAVADGFGVEGSVFTYAVGTLVLFSTDSDLVTGPEALTEGAFDIIAIADPATAPYGNAAIETLAALGVDLTAKIVTGENITQTYQFVDTGNAELGFVALSQVVNGTDGSRWVVPAELHEPIRQDAVLLTSAADNEAAIAFLGFLKGDTARAVIESFGYAVP